VVQRKVDALQMCSKITGSLDYLGRYLRSRLYHEQHIIKGLVFPEPRDRRPMPQPFIRRSLLRQGRWRRQHLLWLSRHD
jgi:hypothetical protein